MALKSLDDRRDFRRAWDNVWKNVKISAEDSVDCKNLSMKMINKSYHYMT
jgi:hypothetical protein